MQYSGLNQRRRTVLLMVVVGLALLTVYKISSSARNEYEPAAPQDAIRLEARINQLEQRLYTIETSVRTLEQQSRIAGATSSRDISPQELAAIRAALQTLDLRLSDDECAIAKLDERTLSPAARTARARTAPRTEPCRLSADTPVRLPERR
jgi:hypothetical protein